MITDRDIAALCAGIYAYPGAAPVAWDHFDDGARSGVCWGLKKIDGVWCLIFRGSVTGRDWWLDAEIIAIFNALFKAHIHPGFHAGIDAVWVIIKAIIGNDRWIAAGHSLGAGRAANVTALGILDGHPPLARIVFGEPKPGWQDFADLYGHAPGRSYRNVLASPGIGHDPVTDEPRSNLIEPYRRATALIDLTVAPDPADSGEFVLHHIPLYASACPSTTIV